jgi:virginiamycin B lyase
MKAIRVAAFAVLAIPAGAIAQDNPLDPKEATVPWSARERARDPIQTKDGKVWFVIQAGNGIGQLNPATGEFKRFVIDSGTNPHNIVTDEKGGLWFTGNRNGKLYQITDAENFAYKAIKLDSAVRDPHTLIFGTDGIGWFSAQGSQYMGRIDPKTGDVKYFRPSVLPSNPYGVVVDSKNRPWFDLFRTNRIATVDPKTLEYKEYVLPDTLARPRRIAVTSDDIVWYGDYRLGKLGRLDPKTGKVETFDLPSGNRALAYAMATDDQDRIWVAETGVVPNKFAVFDPKSKTFVAHIPVPSNGAAANTIRHMTYNKATKQLWFGTDAGTIGHINVPKEIRKLTP